MKILAIEKEVPGIAPDSYKPHLKTEALRVWELYQAGVVREIYFQGDRANAVLIMECGSLSEAQVNLDSLPLVQAGLIHFEVTALAPYRGYARLFAKET
jgi:hypothetical protein